MNERKFIHTKTGKPYTLLTTKFKQKISGTWIDKELCLYRADYPNPDGQYFVRTQEDFFENFTEIN